MRFPRIYLSVVHPIEGESSGDGILDYVFVRGVLQSAKFRSMYYQQMSDKIFSAAFFFPEMKLSKRSHLLRAQSEIFRELCIKIYLLKRHLIRYNFIEERIWCYIKIKLSNRQICVSFSYSYILIVFNQRRYHGGIPNLFTGKPPHSLFAKRLRLLTSSSSDTHGEKMRFFISMLCATVLHTFVQYEKCDASSSATSQECFLVHHMTCAWEVGDGKIVNLAPLIYSSTERIER